MAKPLLSNKWLRSLRVERITNEVHPLRCFAGIPTHQPPPRCVGFLFNPGSFHVTDLANQFYRHAAPGSCLGCECPDVIGYNRCWTQKSPVGRTLPGLANSNSRNYAALGCNRRRITPAAPRAPVASNNQLPGSGTAEVGGTGVVPEPAGGRTLGPADDPPPKVGP